MTSGPPEFCGFDCPHADFPPAETVGICRTMAGVWCRKLREIVSKNVRCEYAKRRPVARTGRRRRGKAAK